MPIDDFIRILDGKRHSPHTIRTCASILRDVQHHCKKPLLQISEAELFKQIYTHIAQKDLSKMKSSLDY